MMKTLLEEIKRHEGFSAYPYKDTVGVLTIGYGYNLEMGMSEELAEKILVWEVDRVSNALPKVIPFWSQLSRARQEVFINMAFNIGVSGLLGFRRMLEAARRGNIESVCAEMRDSKWHGQVGQRADELIEKYRKG